MPINWVNSGDRATLDIQPGGPGNGWQVLDINGGMDAPSGGGRARQTLWGRSAIGGLQPRGFVLTGNPDDLTFNLDYPLSSENLLKRLNCAFTVRARQYCAGNRSVMNSYSAPGMIGYVETTITSFGFDNGLAMSDGQGTDLKRTLAAAASIEEKWVPVTHEDISLSTSDVAYNRVIGISAETCAGACGVGTTEEDAWIAVTDRDASPAYAGGSAPWLYYTIDAWATRGSARIGVYVGADALDVVLAGTRVVIFSDTKPPAYAALADIYNGVADPLLWSFSSGLSETGSNYPKAAVAVDGATILAVGNGGRIWLSTDGGVSFTKTYDTGAITTQNLNAIDAQPGGNAFVGGNAGMFIRLTKTPGISAFSASSPIAVRDAALNLLSSNINSVRTPLTRETEVYLGTAGGEIWRSKTATATRPVFQNMSIDQKGTGSITDMAFAGYKGNVFFYIQTSVANTSRVMRDFSGGNLGGDVEPIGDYVTPSNFKYNSIGAANVNMGIVVGEVHENYAYLGKVRAQ